MYRLVCCAELYRSTCGTGVIIYTRYISLCRRFVCCVFALLCVCILAAVDNAGRRRKRWRRTPVSKKKNSVGLPTTLLKKKLAINYFTISYRLDQRLQQLRLAYIGVEQATNCRQGSAIRPSPVYIMEKKDRTVFRSSLLFGIILSVYD